jgi:hypothetical protein
LLFGLLLLPVFVFVARRSLPAFRLSGERSRWHCGWSS